jgi:hypothetical protein
MICWQGQKNCTFYPSHTYNRIPAKTSVSMKRIFFFHFFASLYHSSSWWSCYLDQEFFFSLSLPMDPSLEPLRDFDILHSSRMQGEKPIQGTDGGDQPVTSVICFSCSRAHTRRSNWTRNWAVVKAVLGLVTLPTLITQWEEKNTEWIVSCATGTYQLNFKTVLESRYV